MIIEAPPAKLLTIGGSDSGGAAGIQADLKTFTALGVYGMSALTVVTAQNSVAVAGLQFLTPQFVASQIQAVLQDYGAAAVKTGFIGQPALVDSIAAALHSFDGPLVVDPVLVNHRGQAMFDSQIVHAYRQQLAPRATLMTPNWRELLLLAGFDAADQKQLEAAISSLSRQGARQLLVTGIVDGESVLDIQVIDGETTYLRTPRIETTNTHGSGDTLSAAIAVFLAQGAPMREAIERARRFTRAAIASGANWQLGAGHGPLAQWLA